MSGNNQRDVEFLEGRLREQPDSMLFARLADIYLEMNRVDEAITLCEAGIKKHPYYSTGHFVLGKCYLANKMHEQAEKELKRVLLFDPKFLAAHKMYGDLMKEIGWENTCDMSYKRILQIDPLEEAAFAYVQKANDASAFMQPGGSAKPASFQEPVPPKAETLPEKPLPETSETRPGFQNMPDAFGAEDTLSDPGNWGAQALQSRPPQEPEPMKPESSDLESKPLPAEHGFEPVGPLPVTPEQEDLLFKEPDSTEIDFVQTQPSPTSPEQTQESELDEEKAQEFSYILDDIFKDESEDDFVKPRDVDEPAENAAKSELTDDPDNFLAELQRSQREPEAPPPPPLPPSAASAPLFTEKPEEPREPEEPEPFKRPTVVDDFESKDQPEKPAAEKKSVLKAHMPRRKKQGDGIATPTLGEIYAAQGQYSKAIDVFETLIKKHPDNEFYQKKLEVLRKKLAEVSDAR